MRRKLLVFVPLALLVLTASVVGGGWLWASTALAESWRNWLAERRAEGYAFTDAEPEIGGFPSRITARFDGPAVRAPAGWHWQLPGVTARAQLTQPLTVHWRAPGTHTLTTQAGRTLRLDGKEARGRATLSTAGALQRGRMRLAEVDLTGLRAGRVGAEHVTARMGGGANAGEHRVPLRTEARQVTLPAPLALPLGRTVRRIRIDATLRGPLPDAITREGLQAWRSNGGALEVHAASVHWADVTVKADGQVALDEKLRPAGTLQVDVRGLEPAVRALLEAGWVSERIAGYARMLAAALQQVQDEGPKTITVPLHFRNGKVLVGPMPLGRLSPVLADRTSRPDAPR
ncbi:hypothetical protein SAMN05216241_11052 [Limimonas halophila]|uniref:DUF2125 domain-containing protein n=1 Tax=Limimonas halophila TaxID=1082479 RepID=A0A1G7TTM9_9PROT|nr:DUF2125 domain-containing protein [Limimonas halophila]SDG38059.1 hypothetical protein SAMN05216241_11052 [Limimonas halophila]